MGSDQASVMAVLPRKVVEGKNREEMVDGGTRKMGDVYSIPRGQQMLGNRNRPSINSPPEDPCSEVRCLTILFMT